MAARCIDRGTAGISQRPRSPVEASNLATLHSRYHKNVAVSRRLVIVSAGDPIRTNSTGNVAAVVTRPRLLTAPEAAELLAIRESTVRDLARRGVVPSVKVGRLMRFVEADLIAYVDGLRGL